MELQTILSFYQGLKREEHKRQLFSQKLKGLLKDHNCQTEIELARLGKSGSVDTIYPVANWDTLIWDLERLRNRKAILVCLDFVDISSNKTKKDIVNLASFAVIPTSEDPNVYILQYHFRIGDVVFEGIQDVKRIIDCDAVTAFSNGVKGFELNLPGNGLYYFAHRTWLDLQKLISQPLLPE